VVEGGRKGETISRGRKERKRKEKERKSDKGKVKEEFLPFIFLGKGLSSFVLFYGISAAMVSLQECRVMK
jgi:hypothetical protein